MGDILELVIQSPISLADKLLNDYGYSLEVNLFMVFPISKIYSKFEQAGSIIIHFPRTVLYGMDLQGAITVVYPTNFPQFIFFSISAK